MTDLQLNDATVQKPSLTQFTKVFAQIGLLSFGGPAGQISLMHKVVVEEKQWVSNERFMHALNYCMLLPGPEAQQLSTYIGWLLHGRRGGLIAGTLFILPGFMLITALASAYAFFQDTHWLPSLLFGLKASVLAVILQALVRLMGKALITPLQKMVAAFAFVSLFILQLPFPLVIITAGIIGLIFTKASQTVVAEDYLVKRENKNARWPPIRGVLYGLALWQLPIALLLLFHAPSILYDLHIFFSQMAIVTFGGAYAVLAYVAQVAVETNAWITAGEMLDGLALAEATPGPLVLVLTYIGFLAAEAHSQFMPAFLIGVLGAFIATWATFVPSFMFIFVGAPYIEKLRHNRILSNALSTITAAVVGVILNLSIWFGLNVLFQEMRLVSISPDFGISLSLPIITSLNYYSCVVLVISLIMLFRFKMSVLSVLMLGLVSGVVHLAL